MPRMYGALRRTCCITSSTVIQRTLGEASCGHTLMQVSHWTHRLLFH